MKNGAERRKIANKPTNEVHRFCKHGARRAQQKERVSNEFYATYETMDQCRDVKKNECHSERASDMTMSTARYTFLLFGLPLFQFSLFCRCNIRYAIGETDNEFLYFCVIVGW